MEVTIMDLKKLKHYPVTKEIREKVGKLKPENVQYMILLHDEEGTHGGIIITSLGEIINCGTSTKDETQGFVDYHNECCFKRNAHNN